MLPVIEPPVISAIRAVPEEFDNNVIELFVLNKPSVKVRVPSRFIAPFDNETPLLLLIIRLYNDKLLLAIID